MAPPSTAPKLAAIDPDQLGIDTVRQVLEHVEQQVRRLGLRHVIRLPIDAPDSDLASADLALTIADVTRWAQRGEGRADEVPDQISDVLSATTSASDEPGRMVDELGEAEDLADPLTLVLTAAHCRHELAEGTATDSVGLAALAGLSGRQVWHLIKTGEIEARKDGLIDALVARRWLGGRGVPGFDAKAKKK
jgi:hypothetical protein